VQLAVDVGVHLVDVATVWRANVSSRNRRPRLTSRASVETGSVPRTGSIEG